MCERMPKCVPRYSSCLFSWHEGSRSSIRYPNKTSSRPEVLTEIGRNRLRVRQTQLSFGELEVGPDVICSKNCRLLEGGVAALTRLGAFQMAVTVGHCFVGRADLGARNGDNVGFILERPQQSPILWTRVPNLALSHISQLCLKIALVII